MANPNPASNPLPSIAAQINDWSKNVLKEMPSQVSSNSKIWDDEINRNPRQTPSQSQSQSSNSQQKSITNQKYDDDEFSLKWYTWISIFIVFVLIGIVCYMAFLHHND